MPQGNVSHLAYSKKREVDCSELIDYRQPECPDFETPTGVQKRSSTISFLPQNYGAISIDCKEVANAANAMFGNCAQLKMDDGSPGMAGIQPIAPEGTATGPPPAADYLLGDKPPPVLPMPPTKPASGLFLVIYHS